MILPLVLRDEAERDLALARDWYDEQLAGLGDEFLDAVHEKLGEIQRARCTIRPGIVR